MAGLHQRHNWNVTEMVDVVVNSHILFHHGVESSTTTVHCVTTFIDLDQEFHSLSRHIIFSTENKQKRTKTSKRQRC